jgi:hypothetical protein
MWSPSKYSPNYVRFHDRDISEERVGMALTLCIRVRVTLGLNFRLGLRLPWQIVCWFSSAHPAKFRDNTSIKPRPLPSKSFLIYLSSYYSRLYHLANDSVVEPTDRHTWTSCSESLFSAVIIYIQQVLQYQATSTIFLLSETWRCHTAPRHASAADVPTEMFVLGRKCCEEISIEGRAIAQAVSHRLPIAAARVRSQVRSRGICGGQSGTAAGFLRVLRFPLPILIPPTTPHSSSIIRGWNNRPNIDWRTKWAQSHPTPRN